MPRVYLDIRSSILRHGFTLPLSDSEVKILVNEGKFNKEQLLSYSEPEFLSIDSPIRGDDDTTYAEIITDNLSIDRELSEEEIEKVVDHILSYIKPNYRDMIEEWIYSVLAGEPTKQNVLAKKYNTSRSNICRIMNIAINAFNLHKEEIRDMLI